MLSLTCIDVCADETLFCGVDRSSRCSNKNPSFSVYDRDPPKLLFWLPFVPLKQCPTSLSSSPFVRPRVVFWIIMN